MSFATASLRAAPLCAPRSRARVTTTHRRVAALASSASPPAATSGVKPYEAAVAVCVLFSGLKLVLTAEGTVRAVLGLSGPLALHYVVVAGYQATALGAAVATLALGGPVGCAALAWMSVIGGRLAYLAAHGINVGTLPNYLLAGLVLFGAYSAVKKELDGKALLVATSAVALTLSFTLFQRSMTLGAPLEATVFSAVASAFALGTAALFACLSSGKTTATAVFVSILPPAARILFNAATKVATPPIPQLVLFSALTVAGAVLAYKSQLA